MQLTYNEKKKPALNRYMDYVHASKNQTRKIRTKITKYIREQYPKHGKVIPHQKVKEEKSRKEKSKKTSKNVAKKPFSSKYMTFEQWLAYRKSQGKLNTVATKRIIKAHKKYPNDSLQQLRRGHNVG